MTKYKDINTGRVYDKIPEGKVLPIIVKGQTVTEQAHDDYYNLHPIILEEVVISPEKKESTTMASYYDRMADASPDNYIRAINRDYNDDRIRKANYWEGLSSILLPSQWVGAAIDAALGERDFSTGLWYGNSGYVPENFYYQHPYIGSFINLLTDAAISRGGAKFYKWGNTPKLIGKGAESEVYSAPFWRKVYKVGLDPEYVTLKNSLPESVPHKLVGSTIEGNPVYSQPKMRIPKKLNREKLSKMYLALTNKQYFPNLMDGELIVDFINPSRLLAITDLEIGNIGQNWLGKYKIIDPSVLNIPDYLSLYKKGGKLKNP